MPSLRLALHRRVYRLLFVVLFIGIAGCFGPATMQYDIGSYNRAALNGETTMLMYNVGRLAEKQPPHFMMLATVSQTRTFSEAAGFQWMQAFKNDSSKGNTWQAGPFTTTINENPTITFIPIQGQEFFNRFESPVRDKFFYFFQDQNWESPDREGLKNLFMLFGESLYVIHGDADSGGKCQTNNFYLNKYVADPERHLSSQYHDYKGFKDCVAEILDRPPSLSYTQIDAHRSLDIKAGAEPSATDVIGALEKGYELTSDDKSINASVKVPAFLDFEPDFGAPPVSPPPLDPALVLYNRRPGPMELTYGTPKGYSWKQYLSESGNLAYALVPEGYSVKGGELVKFDRCGQPGCLAANCHTGSCISDKCANNKCQPASCEAGRCPHDMLRLSYSDKILNAVYPSQQDFFYVELRHNDHKDFLHKGDVFDKTAEDLCFGSPKEQHDAKTKRGESNLFCGFFKVGNLLQVMQRLGDMAKACQERDAQACEAANFKLDRYPPPAWADQWAKLGLNEFVYEPAHNPNERENLRLAQRDREVFLNLYKLYQTSLVNTSQLVTAPPPVTISK